MTNSFYGVVYRGGIALPMGIANVKFLIEHNSEVELLERFKPEEAYLWATQKYVERYLNLLDLTPFITGAAQPKLNQKNMNQIQIPLPSMEEQIRIMSILDRFDAIANDISIGLPAEIAARQKQYEYYRDKLLTFKPLA